MLDQNRKWLEQANPGLLKNYKQQTQREHKSDGEMRCVRMSHQDRNPDLPPSYISPVYYQKQKDIIDILEGEPQGELRFCIIGGTDGGHLLNKITKENQIKHLVIIEPFVDSFHHSLQITDWPALFKDFDERGGTIYLHIGEVSLEVMQRMGKHLTEIGPYNASNIFATFDNTEPGANAVGAVVRCLQDCINSLGFYDDERVGLAHSLDKLERGAKFLSTYKRPWIDKPIVVCGNGPSLTGLLPHIKKHRNNMFLMGCGSATASLLKAGVKPDFHVEQERPKCSSDFTKLRTTPEFRKGISLIALNVVHPQSHDLFEDANYCLKSNDFGAIVTQKHLGDSPLLLFVNPQVANCGASVSVALGFKHIYLAGADCSFSKDGACHAKEYKGPSVEIQGIIKVKGNFRDEVETNSLYNDSKNAFELLIKRSEGCKFYNLSDGAFIAGAKPTKKFRAKIHKPIKKSQVLSAFQPYRGGVDKEQIRRAFVGDMFSLTQKINEIPEKIKGKDEAFYYIDNIYNKLRDMKNTRPLLWYLVKGTITTQLVFMANCADLDVDAFDKSAANLKELAKLIHDEIKGDFYRFDDWEKSFD